MTTRCYVKIYTTLSRYISTLAAERRESYKNYEEDVADPRPTKPIVIFHFQLLLIFPLRGKLQTNLCVLKTTQKTHHLETTNFPGSEDPSYKYDHEKPLLYQFYPT